MPRCRRLFVRLNIELFPKPADKLGLLVDNGEHPAQEEQLARLHGLDVSGKRCRGCRKLNVKVFQPIRTARLRTFSAYHRPEC